MKPAAVFILVCLVVILSLLAALIAAMIADYLQHPTPLSANIGAYSFGVVWGGCKLDWGWYDEARRKGETGSVRVC